MNKWQVGEYAESLGLEYSFKHEIIDSKAGIALVGVRYADNTVGAIGGVKGHPLTPEGIKAALRDAMPCAIRIAEKGKQLDEVLALMETLNQVEE